MTITSRKCLISKKGCFELIPSSFYCQHCHQPKPSCQQDTEYPHCLMAVVHFRSWPSYGLCPYQPLPARIGTVFDAALDEYCMDKEGKKRFIPCKFSADYSCIVVFFDLDYILAGCISDNGIKLIKEQSFENDTKSTLFRSFETDTDKVEVDTIDLYTINRKCLNTSGCARAEVSRRGSSSSMMLDACCCKGEHCVNLDAYVHTMTNASTSTNGRTPFEDLMQMYILAFCYATSLATVTINFYLSFYSRYCNSIILKNQ